MANRYWVGGTGTWDAATTTNWSTTSGGAGGASVPSTTDTVIFDSASNIAGSGASYTCTRITAAAVQGIQIANPSAGTVTFAGSSAIGISTVGLTITGTVNWTNTGILTFSGAVSAVCNTGTTTITNPVVVNGSTVTLNGDFSTSSSFTLTSGTIVLSTFTLTASTANISGSSTRLFNFGTGVLNLTGNNATIFTAATQTNLTILGTPTINCSYSGAAGTRTITPGAIATTFNFNITAGTDIVILTAGRFNNLSFTGFSGTLSASTGALSIYGNLTMSPTMTQSATGIITFASTTTGKTITSAGEILPAIVFDGVGGGWALADALNVGTNSITVTNGTFDTGGFNVTADSLRSDGGNTRSIILGVSSVTLSGTLPINFTSSLTFSAASSSINITNSTTGINGGSKIYGTVNYTSTTITTAAITGQNTYNILNFAEKTSNITSTISIVDSLTITDTFNIPSTSARFRYLIKGFGSVSRTISAAAVSLSDVDFSFINGSGTAAPFTGTRLGDQLNNTNITFPTGKTVYWNLSGTQNWSADAWSLTSGGTPALNNFPLPQDTVIFDNANGNTTVIIDQNWAVGTIDMTARTSPMTFTASSFGPIVYGDFKLGSGISLTGTAAITMGGNSSYILSAGKTWGNSFNISSTGTVTLSDAFTSTNTLTLTSGTLMLNNFVITAFSFSSSNSNIRSIAFGTSGRIVVTGTSTVWDTGTVTNFTTSGTARVDSTSAGSSTRIMNTGYLDEKFSVSLNITAGTGNFYFSTNNSVKNLNFTGFAGSWPNVPLTIFGSLTVSTGMNVSAGISTVTFLSTYPGNTITTNGKVLGFPISFSGLFGEYTLSDNLSTGTTATSIITHAAGTLILGTRNITCPSFNTNSTYLRTLNFGTGGSITVNGTGTVWDATTTHNMTVAGTPVVSVTNATATARTIIAGTHSETNSISFFISAGTSSTTVGGNIRNLSFTGFSGTLPNTARTIYGNLTLSTGMTITAGAATTTFAATSTGKTITSSGKTIGCPITFNGVGGEWALQDALNTGTNTITLTNGSFVTNNFNITAGSFQSINSNVRSLTLGSSTLTLSSNFNGFLFSGVNATVNTGTSNIIFTGLGSTLSSNLTYHNVSYINTAQFPTSGNGEFRIEGNNIFNNLTISAPNAINPGTIRIAIYGNQTINGILTISASPSPAHRVELRRDIYADDTQSTLTVAAVSTLTDVDFKDIAITGASAPWSGTRLGNAGNNSGITFDAPKTVYWNLSGAQNWNANAWALSSGGTPAINNFPLPQDTAIFDNTGAATTVSINGPYRFGNLDMSARTTAMTLNNFSNDNTKFFSTIIYGDLKLGTGVALTGFSGTLKFQGYSKTQTLSSAGKTLIGNVNIESASTILLLGDALNIGINSLIINRGTFNTGTNYSVTAGGINAGAANPPATINLNASTVTLSNLWQVSGLTTLNPGTSSIVLTSASATFNGDGKTYYNVTFNNTAITNILIIGSTFNNLNIPGRTGSAGISQIIFSGDQIINGTLTIGAGSSAVHRTWLRSNVQGTTTTITANARSTLTDLDFRDITAAGAAGTWSGTRLGDCGNNTGITPSAAKTVYWVGGAGNWSGTEWATTSNGAAAIANFPLAQDYTIFTNTGVGTVTVDANWNIGTIDYSLRTTASTLATGTTSPTIYGNVILYTGLTITGTSGLIFARYSGTQTIISAGRVFPYILQFQSIAGTISLGDALITTSQLYHAAGTFNLNGFSATCNRFSSDPSPTGSVRLINFGSSSINITGNNNTALSINGTNFSYTGTPTINLTYSGATGKRFLEGTTTETNSPNVNITAGTDIIEFTNFDVLNYNDTGFTGTYGNTGVLNVYGNLTARNTPGRVNFLATSGTKNIILTQGYSGILYFNCPGATYQLQSNISFGTSTSNSGYVNTSTITSGIILESGTFDANGYNIDVARFNSSFTSARTLNLSSGIWNVFGVEGMKAASIFSSTFESLFTNTYSWDISDSTNLTLIPGTSTIVLSHFSSPYVYNTEALTRYMYMGGLTYNNIVVSPLRSATTETGKTYAIYGNNTFNTITNTAQPTTVAFEGGSTNTFADFLLSGTADKLVTVKSTNSTQATLKKPATWNVGANSVDGGNNSGLTFSGTVPNYLSFTNIIGALTGVATYVKHRFLAFFS